MLFNSIEFIFFFLPFTLLIFFVIGRQSSFWSRKLAVVWLVCVSLFFYSWSNHLYLPLFVVSMLVNYSIGTWIGNETVSSSMKKSLLMLGITFNIALLAYFKYGNFSTETINFLFGLDSKVNPIILPLGISFFTFQQIAYLVDSYRVETQSSLLDYLLFVSFFPKLVAGPIVQHKEIIPQLSDQSTYRINAQDIAIGLTFFALGLSKKVIFADSLSEYVVPVFSTAVEAPVPLIDAWIGALAYTLQLYFDFSGYSDIAIGVSRCFGIRLPLNFDSPYKALSISDFWRRWHITLSNFLRDYLYIPLGGNRKGELRRNFNLMTTMLLGGLWHGAGWTFVFWGGLHGFYLTVNHQWRSYLKYLGHDPKEGSWLRNLFGWLLTFIAVVIGWVFFRAESMGAALQIIKGMFGLSGFTASNSPLYQLFSMRLVFVLLVLLALVCLTPNIQELVGQYDNNPKGAKNNTSRLRFNLICLNPSWQPNQTWGLIIGLLIFLAVKGILTASGSEFVYASF